MALKRWNYPQAEAHLQESLTIRRTIKDRQGEGVALSYLGDIAQQQGHLDDARRYLRESLVALREVGDEASEREVVALLQKLGGK